MKSSEIVIIDDRLNEVVRRIVEETDPDKIILFGSRVREENGEDSDYDLFVLKRGARNAGELEKRIYRRLFGTGLPVDIIVEAAETYEELKSNPFLIYKEISRHGRVLYEK